MSMSQNEVAGEVLPEADTHIYCGALAILANVIPLRHAKAIGGPILSRGSPGDAIDRMKQVRDMLDEARGAYK